MENFINPEKKAVPRSHKLQADHELNLTRDLAPLIATNQGSG